MADGIGEELVTYLRALYRPEVAPRYRHAFAPAMFELAAAAALRDAVTADGWTPFYVADRGRYHVNTRYTDDAMFGELRALAEAVVEAPLDLGEARWMKLGRGDYQLTRGDAVDRTVRGPHVELSLDFSETQTGRADIVYTDGAEAFAIAQWPTSIALVERTGALHRYDRYLDHLVGDATVWRLRLALPFRER
jgi:hypothetical protein